MGTGTKTNKTNRQPNPGKPSEECVQIKETPKIPNGKTQMSKMSKTKTPEHWNTERAKTMLSINVNWFELSNTKECDQGKHTYTVWATSSPNTFTILQLDVSSSPHLENTRWEYSLRLFVSRSTRQLHADDTIDFTWCSVICHILELQFIIVWNEWNTVVRTFRNPNRQSVGQRPPILNLQETNQKHRNSRDLLYHF